MICINIWVVNVSSNSSDQLVIDYQRLMFIFSNYYESLPSLMFTLNLLILLFSFLDSHYRLLEYSNRYIYY